MVTNGVSGDGQEPDATIVVIARPHPTAPHSTAQHRLAVPKCGKMCMTTKTARGATSPHS
jgi:hypothetical protein